jgi:hypothetical protein
MCDTVDVNDSRISPKALQREISLTLLAMSDSLVSESLLP